MGLSITTTAKAIYANGVFVPLEEVDLFEGCPVTLTVVRPPRKHLDTEFTTAELDAIFAAAKPPPSEHRTFGDYVEWLQDVQSRLPDELLDGRPTDGAKNYKHYLYGHPKVED